ncbi:MAG: helix-turn-helix transcriptional regulator [Clostridia bacterium]|nr:helix-turn-helix transcriptional regulator [Clostridia bacterium]
MVINENLKQLRIDSGLTQYELAKNLNIGQSTIVGYEKGDREPTITNISRYAKYFGVSIDFIVGLEDDFGIKKTDGAVAPSAYSKEEQKIIEDYRRLNYMSKKLILQTLATLQPSASETKQKKKGNN